jgi:hypothetical protein
MNGYYSDLFLFSGTMYINQTRHLQFVSVSKRKINSRQIPALSSACNEPNTLYQAWIYNLCMGCFLLHFRSLQNKNSLSCACMSCWRSDVLTLITYPVQIQAQKALFYFPTLLSKESSHFLARTTTYLRFTQLFLRSSKRRQKDW